MGILNKNNALAIAALLACGSAVATEDYDLRYAPGMGGADMSAPFEGGWVFQAPAYVYSGNVRTTSTITTPFSTIHAINPAVPAIPGAYTLTTVDANTQINVYGLLPRLSYMGSTTFLGATVGGTVLLPLVNKKNNARLTSVSTVGVSPLPAVNNAAIAASINPIATAQAQHVANGNSNSDFLTGDPEISPILRWSTEATQTLFILTAVLPLGDYDPNRAANPGAGRFWTFRPAFQFSYIGDGWDFGGRAAFSYNTRNTETHYKSGNYVNVDVTLMKSISDSMRVGVAAYGVDQVTRDSRSEVPADPVMKARQDVTLDQKGHVAGIGPEFAYIHGAGDYMIDGRIMKEFAAVTRPKGFTAVVTLSKPF